MNVDADIATAAIFAFPAEKQIGLIRRTVDVLDSKNGERSFGEPYLRRTADTMARRMAAAGIDGNTIVREVAAFRKAVEDESIRRFLDKIGMRRAK
ncbi:DUF6074 family protein [Mesorhizobium sp. M1342]|uniref:DUF6074 family protein n=1 Tax=Mesorhizobium sp. M1342 TaxID=2957088 RepID=UPI0033378AE8